MERMEISIHTSILDLLGRSAPSEMAELEQLIEILLVMGERALVRLLLGLVASSELGIELGIVDVVIVDIENGLCRGAQHTQRHIRMVRRTGRLTRSLVRITYIHPTRQRLSRKSIDRDRWILMDIDG